MTTTTVTRASATRTPAVGEPVELARYTITTGERIIRGQRIDGVVRVTDHPASGRSRVVLIERGLEQDGNAALHGLLNDYLHQAHLYDEIPALASPLDRWLRTEQALGEPTGLS